MLKARLFKGKSVEDVARGFAQIVSYNYASDLRFWQAIAIDDKDEYEDWGVKIKNEPGIVLQNAYDKILNIIRNPQENKKYYKRRWKFFTSKKVIRIVLSSGFYRDLLPGENVESSMQENVEYILNIKKMTIVKRTHSQFVTL